MKREKAHITVWDVELNYLSQIQSMTAVQAGPPFLNLCQMFLRKKKICIPDIQEQSIIVKNAEVIMDIYLMMGLNQQESAIATMVRV